MFQGTDVDIGKRAGSDRNDVITPLLDGIGKERLVLEVIEIEVTSLLRFVGVVPSLNSITSRSMPCPFALGTSVSTESP